MNLTHLPENLRLAGVAYIVAQTAELEEEADHRYHVRAHHWALMRGLPTGSEEAARAAVADAMLYTKEHESDVREFLAFRDRERRRA